jgi:hypothetical protein
MLESIRHAEKTPDGSITEEGRAEARALGGRIAAEVLAGPENGVTFVVPSSVGRAVATRDELEGGILARLDQAEATFLEVGDTEAFAHASAAESGRLIVTGIQPQRIVGFGQETSYIPAWKRLTARFGGEEYYTMLSWAAHPDELAGLAEEVAARFPSDTGEAIRPSEFRRTPEREALGYLRLYRRIGEVATARFPGRPTRFVQVGHNTADFATVALLGQPISVATVRNLLGGESRHFLESASFDLGAGEVSFRGERILSVPVADAVAALEAASRERAAAWATADGRPVGEALGAYEV